MANQYVEGAAYHQPLGECKLRITKEIPLHLNQNVTGKRIAKCQKMMWGSLNIVYGNTN